MKHLMKCLCIVLILILTAASAAAEVKLNTVFQYRTVIQPVPGTGLLIVESKQDNSRSLYNKDGREVVPCAAKYLDYLSNGFFVSYNDKDSFTDKTLWKADGRQVGSGYYSFKIFNDRWAAAFVVNPQEVDSSEKDIKISGKFYQYERIDLFYITDEAGDSIAPVASLDREAYSDAAVHGEYIAITDRNKTVSLYNSAFEPISVKLSSASKPLYSIDKYRVISLIDNSILGDGYAEVEEINLNKRMLVKAVRIAMDGTKCAALLNPDGTVLLPADYELIDITNNYAVVADLEKQQGLFSLDEQRFLVPCAYTSIVPCGTDSDKYVHNGYVCVEKEGKLGFYDVANGVESCKAAYSKRAVDNYGCALVFTSLEGELSIIAADGEISVVDADEILSTQGDGYLLEASKNGSFGLIDWHGNIILPIDHYKEISVTDDSQAIIRTSTGLQLDTVTR